MPVHEVLMLAVTRMLGGVCIAGMTPERDPVTSLRWVRPTREFGHVLLGDITTVDGTVLRPFDVVCLDLLRPRPDPPHTEDWIADFARNRPRIVRRLEGERRAGFLRKHLDGAPQEVLEGQQRSLCLVKPASVQGCFRLDSYSGKFQARLAFELECRASRGTRGTRGTRVYGGASASGGLSVTDLKWRALGRAWLPEAGGWTEFDAGDLEARLGVRRIYLALGLTRSFQGTYWPIIIGVHTVPDYEAEVNYEDL